MSAMFGGCNPLNGSSHNVVLGGGASGNWTTISPTHGKFVATLSKGGDCGGTNGFDSAVCTLIPCGCLKVKVTVSGTSGDYNFQPTATASAPVGGVSMQGENGGHICTSKPLAPTGGGSNTFTTTITASGPLVMQFTCSPWNEHNPESTVTFDVQVLYT